LRIRSRHALNTDTIREGGREAIDKVMRTQPAVFLKLLVLLVPRQMTLDHSGGVKAMTDEQLERGIDLIEEMLAQREAGANAKVIEGQSEAAPSLPAPVTHTGASRELAQNKGTVVAVVSGARERITDCLCLPAAATRCGDSPSV
jgi:hypothetical protein